MNQEMKKQKIAYGFKEDKYWTVEDMVKFVLTGKKPKV